MTRRTSLLLLALLPLACRCPLGFGRRKPVMPGTVLQRAAAAFPEAEFSKLLEWEGTRLYAYMNGAAEAYYARGFRKLGTIDAVWKDTQSKVELYLVDGAENAAGLFADFDDGQGKPLNVGERSTAWDGRELEAIVQRGPYFGRIFVYGNDAAAQELLRRMASAIDRSIPQ